MERKHLLLAQLDHPDVPEGVFRVAAADKLHNARTLLSQLRVEGRAGLGALPGHPGRVRLVLPGRGERPRRAPSRAASTSPSWSGRWTSWPAGSPRARSASRPDPPMTVRFAGRGATNLADMGSSLRDIPGAGGGKKKRRGLGKVGGGPASKPWQPAPKVAGTSRGPPEALRPGPALPGPALGGRPVQPGPRPGLRRPLRGRRHLAPAGEPGHGHQRLRGRRRRPRPPRSERLAIELQHRADQPRRAGATVSFDGTDVTERGRDHRHGLHLDPARRTAWRRAPTSWRSRCRRRCSGSETLVDDLRGGRHPTRPRHPHPRRGRHRRRAHRRPATVDERVDLTAEGEPVEVDEDGHFSVTFATPPAGAVDFIATDPAGNSTALAVPVDGGAAVRPRAVHLSADAWADDGLRDGALALLDGEQVDTVVLDVKDECGIVALRHRGGPGRPGRARSTSATTSRTPSPPSMTTAASSSPAWSPSGTRSWPGGHGPTTTPTGSCRTRRTTRGRSTATARAARRRPTPSRSSAGSPTSPSPACAGLQPRPRRGGRGPGRRQRPRSTTSAAPTATRPTCWSRASDRARTWRR